MLGAALLAYRFVGKVRGRLGAEKALECFRVAEVFRICEEEGGAEEGAGVGGLEERARGLSWAF